MKYYVNLTTGKGEVNGEKLESKQFPQFDFFYYVSAEGIVYICELRSGFAVGYGSNLGEAKSNVIQKINANGVDTARRLLDIVIKTFGVMNTKEK